jgi:hypothetical protein
VLAARQPAFERFPTSPPPPPSGIGVVIDLGPSPSKGERTAKLTLVEFSDYQ